MCLLQIGGVGRPLVRQFKKTYNGVPWRNIKGMRNMVAHKYGDISVTTVWETVIIDIPVLREYCIRILEELRSN